MEGPATASQGSLSPSVKAVKGEGSIARAITPDDATQVLNICESYISIADMLLGGLYPRRERAGEGTKTFWTRWSS